MDAGVNDLMGGTSGVFAGLDQFGRITDQRWQNSITGTPTDIDRYQYGYDRDSNRLWKANVVGPWITGRVQIRNDRLNNEYQSWMQRVSWNGLRAGGISIGSRITGRVQIQNDRPER